MTMNDTHRALKFIPLALARQSRADLYPSVTGTASSNRSGNRSATTNSHSATASWELDLWGKLRHTLEENRASAQASEAELANITLSAQSTLAQDYFQLRVMDQQLALYQQSITAYERYVRIIGIKYQAGSEGRDRRRQSGLLS